MVLLSQLLRVMVQGTGDPGRGVVGGAGGATAFSGDNGYVRDANAAVGVVETASKIGGKMP